MAVVTDTGRTCDVFRYSRYAMIGCRCAPGCPLLKPAHTVHDRRLPPAIDRLPSSPGHRPPSPPAVGGATCGSLATRVRMSTLSLTSPCTNTLRAGSARTRSSLSMRASIRASSPSMLSMGVGVLASRTFAKQSRGQSRERREAASATHIVVIAVRAVLVRLFVRRHVFPEGALALRRGRIHGHQLRPRRAVGRAPGPLATFLQMKCISMVRLSVCSSFSAWHSGHCGEEALISSKRQSKTAGHTHVVPPLAAWCTDGYLGVQDVFAVGKRLVTGQLGIYGITR